MDWSRVVARGGAWGGDASAYEFRGAYRYGYDRDLHYDYRGLRLVRIAT
jgi:hypothetical protein